MDFNIIKEKTLKAKEWIYSHPKEFYKYSFIVIIICFAFSAIKFIFFPPAPITNIKIPMVFSKSEEKIEKENKNRAKRESQMKVIVKELQTLKSKREKEGLTQTDSVRIEYLYNQYQILQNGN